MRRASQKNTLVTLNEINVTPLLDLAFVLLIIFIITRPMMEQGMTLELPQGGSPDRPISQEDIARVEIDQSGNYTLNRRPATLAQIEQGLVSMYAQNPDLVVMIAGDKRTIWGNGTEVIDICLRNGISRFSVRTVGEGNTP